MIRWGDVKELKIGKPKVLKKQELLQACCRKVRHRYCVDTNLQNHFMGKKLCWVQSWLLTYWGYATHFIANDARVTWSASKSSCRSSNCTGLGTTLLIGLRGVKLHSLHIAFTWKTQLFNSIGPETSTNTFQRIIKGRINKLKPLEEPKDWLHRPLSLPKILMGKSECHYGSQSSQWDSNAGTTSDTDNGRNNWWEDQDEHFTKPDASCGLW